MFKDINNLIISAMKQKDENRLNVLRMIKSTFVKAEKDGIVIDDAVEAKLLNKMKAQAEDSIEQFKKGNRMDLVDIETKQLEILNEYVPKAASNEDIFKEIEEIIQNGVEPSMKNMKIFMTEIQKKYPIVNGKIISDYLKNR